MKKKLHLPLTVTICLLVAALALSNAVPLGAVVCVGSDGHVGVQSCLEGCCVAKASPAQSSAVGSAARNSACGNCADVQLKVSPLRAKESRLERPDLGSECVECLMSFFNDRSMRSTDAVNTDQQRHSLQPLSTVILRT